MKEIIKKVFRHVTVFGFSLIILVTVAQVIARYVFNAPLMWGEELCRYVYVWVVMFAVGIGIMTDEHISFTVLANQLGPKGRFILFLVTQFFINLFAAVIFVYGLMLCKQNATILSSAMKIPMSIPYAGIPVGVIGIVFHNVLKIQEEYKKYKASKAVKEW